MKKSQLLTCLVFAFLILLLSGFGALAAGPTQQRETFEEIIRELSSLGDRSTGSAGNQAAADYIKKKFSELEFEVVDSQRFATPVMQYGRSTLSISDRGITIPIHPLNSNAISPQKIAAPGISGPLVYAGNGNLEDFDGKTVENSVILMEFESGRNWLYAADLGAKALIYVDRQNFSQDFLRRKVRTQSN